MISILIPTYNYNVLSLVEELHRQGVNLDVDFEILVMDDGSPSPSEENKKINSLSNASYIIQTTNLGRTAIRTKLAEQAQFNWLLFLDADIRIPSEIFISQYVRVITNSTDVIFGGVSYDEEIPPRELSLRWHYGNSREAKSVEEREKSPYFIISQNLFIKKQIFLTANVVSENYYGLDNLFSNQLQRIKATVSHIDNPVIHLGLENNQSFTTKALKAVETTIIFEERGLMDSNLRPIQKAYKKLTSFGATGLFSFIISKMKRTMEKNFDSGSPNLFWFDLYRLNHYIQLKKKPRA